MAFRRKRRRPVRKSRRRIKRRSVRPQRIGYRW